MGTILIDSPSRELIAACLIRSELLSHNKKANFISTDETDIFIDQMDDYFNVGSASLLSRSKKDKHFILTPSYNVKRTPAITFRSKFRNVPLIVYHSEQFFAHYYDEEKFSISKFNEYKENIDAHLVWGSYFKDKLVSLGVPDNKIYVVGNIKNEIAHYMSSSDIIRMEKGNHKYDYMFVSSFSLAEMTDEEFRLYRRQFNLPSWIDERPNAAQCREGMISFIELVAKNLPDKSIIVRRHPGESPNGYSRLKKYNNVVFSEMGPFSFDALSSKLVLLQDSTSIFELETLGIEWISVDFNHSTPLYLVEPTSLFKRHSKDTVLKSLLSNDYSGILGRREIEKFDVEYFIGPNDKRVSSRIADAIRQVITQRRKNKIFFSDIKCFLILIIKSFICISLRFDFISNLPFFYHAKNRLVKNQEYRRIAEHSFTSSLVNESMELAKKWKSL